MCFLNNTSTPPKKNKKNSFSGITHPEKSCGSPASPFLFSCVVFSRPVSSFYFSECYYLSFFIFLRLSPPSLLFFNYPFFPVSLFAPGFFRMFCAFGASGLAESDPSQRAGRFSTTFVYIRAGGSPFAADFHALCVMSSPLDPHPLNPLFADARKSFMAG